MVKTSRPASIEAGLSSSVAALLVAILVFAPLIKGGNRPLPLLLLELAAVALISILALQPALWPRLGRRLLIFVGCLVALPLLQIIPLPEALWAQLPGRAYYAQALNEVGATPRYPALSLIPSATEAAWLTLLVPVAVFLATISVDRNRLRNLANLFIGLALIQAVIGLAQYGSGWVAVFWPGGEGVVRAQGTYANPDHLAGLLEMALPVALALLVANFQHGQGTTSRATRTLNLRQRIARIFGSGFRVNQFALYGAATIGILLGLIFSRSRTGIALAMLGIPICAALFSRHVGGQRSNRLITIFSVIGLALAAVIGLAPVLSGFSAKALTDPYRWSIYVASLEGIRELLPFGSGFGTYPWIFRRFHPGDVPQFVNHAHNDYLEWLLEGGIPAALLLISGIGLYVLRWRAVWPRNEQWSSYDFLRMGAGIGLLLISLHGLLDFNMHIPANAIYFAFLAGIFFHPETPDRGTMPPRKPEPKPLAQDKPKPTRVAIAAPPPSEAVPPKEEAIRNPFAD